MSTGRAFDLILLFLSIQLMSQSTGGFGTSVYKITHGMQEEFGECEEQSSATEWEILILVCHAFPHCWEEAW